MAEPQRPSEIQRLPPNPQREAVLSLIPDEETKKILGTGITRVELRPYDDLGIKYPPAGMENWKKWNPSGEFLSVMRRQLSTAHRGDFYKYVLALGASGMGNPFELQNAFGVLRAVSRRELQSSYHYSEADDIVKPSLGAFLKSVIPPPKDKARPMAVSIAQGIVTAWQNYTKDPFKRTNASHDVFSDFFYEKNQFGRWTGGRNKQNEPFFAEVFYLLILDPNVPLEFREFVLSELPYFYKFGELDRDRLPNSQVNPFFDRDVSFWQDVNAGWIFPQLAHVRPQLPSRWQLDPASLGKAYDDLSQKAGSLEAQLRSMEGRLGQTLTDNAKLAEENARLHNQLSQLAFLFESLQSRRGPLSQEQALAASYYKNFGGHPLDVLRIGREVWRVASAEDRRKTILATFREKARQYHYNVLPSDPTYDSQKADLMNQAFTRLKEAYDYLTKNLDRADFPDLQLPPDLQ